MKFFYPLLFTLCVGTLFSQSVPLGYQASNFKFPDGSQLSQKGAPHIVLVYGDSACPACQQAQASLKLVYKRWLDFGFKVVYIALDEDRELLKKNFGEPPWPIYCDEQSWDSPWVASLHVAATPTLFALDSNLKVLREAESVGQMDFWIRTQ